MAAGWGASLVPQDDEGAKLDARIVRRPLRPALWRPLGLALRQGIDDGPTRQVVAVLQVVARGAD